MSTPSALRSRSRSRSTDGVVAAAKAAAAGFDILKRVKDIQLEVEDLRDQLGSQLRQTESKISRTDDRENIALGLIALQTRLRRQRRQLDKVISTTDDLEKIAVELIVLGTSSAVKAARTARASVKAGRIAKLGVLRRRSSAPRPRCQQRWTLACAQIKDCLLIDRSRFCRWVARSFAR